MEEAENPFESRQKLNLIMKKTIPVIKTGFTLLLFTLLFAGCKKEQNIGIQHQITTTDLSKSQSEENGATISLDCGGTIPDSIAVPDGNKMAYKVYATGVQIYQVKRSTIDPAVFVWVNIAPSATLFLRSDFTNQVGIHYGGPSWEFTKGPYKNEKAVAAKLKQVNMNGTIPWLLLKVVDSLSSDGNQVSYIQRVCTTGGLMPSSIPVENDLGKTESVPYTAIYLFYEKKN